MKKNIKILLYTWTGSVIFITGLRWGRMNWQNSSLVQLSAINNTFGRTNGTIVGLINSFTRHGMILEISNQNNFWTQRYLHCLICGRCHWLTFCHSWVWFIGFVYFDSGGNTTCKNQLFMNKCIDQWQIVNLKMVRTVVK